MSSRITKEPYRSGHVYALDGKRVPGVTTILRTAINKPGLSRWFAQQGALWARDHAEEARRMDERDFLRAAGQAPDAARDAKAATGRTLHEYADKLLSGEPLTPELELEGRAELIADFLDRHEVRPLASELVVYHEQWRYAGTFDLLADLRMPDGSWQRWLLDYKTGAGIYSDHVLQLAAYRYATHVQRTPDEDWPMPPVDGAGIVHVKDNAWELVPVRADVDAFDAFTQCVLLHRFLGLRDLVSDPLAKPEPVR